MSKILMVVLVTLAITIFEQARSADPPRNQRVTASLYASALLVGAQLGARIAADEGKVPQSYASCMQALDPSSLTDVVEAVLVDNLTRAELQASDAFYRTTAGRKEAKVGMLDVYTANGKTPPEDYPDTSDAEYKAVEDFRNSAVGKKLWKVLKSDSARRAFEARFRALANSCGGTIDPFSHFDSDQ